MGTQCKATIKAYKAGSPHHRFELSTIDLYSVRSRDWFARLCTSVFSEDEPIIKEDLNQVLEKIEAHRPSNTTKKKHEMSGDAKNEALAFLKSADLFDQINCLLLRNIAVHCPQQMITNMLNRYINIITYLLFADNDINQFIRDMCRKRV